MERQRSVHEKNGKKICTLPSPPSPLASLAPVADSSTRVDSPSHGLVTSSLCNPSPAQLSQTPNHNLLGLVLTRQVWPHNAIQKRSSCSQTLISCLPFSLPPECLGIAFGGMWEADD